MSRRGRFIVLEGRDGVGKTIQVPHVAAELRRRFQVEVRETREPGATALGALIRETLLKSDIDICGRAEMLLFASDNAQHVHDVVEPTLAAGEWVVSDRGMGSALAYQGFGSGWGREVVGSVYGWATAGITADVTVMLDCSDDEIVRRRAAQPDPPDNIERKPSEFHAAVRDGYRSIAAEDPTWQVVDAAGLVHDVTERIISAVAAALDL